MGTVACFFCFWFLCRNWAVFLSFYYWFVREIISDLWTNTGVEMESRLLHGTGLNPGEEIESLDEYWDGMDM